MANTRTREHVHIHYRQHCRDKNYTKEISFGISQFRIQFENNAATVQVADKCKRFAIFLADNTQQLESEVSISRALSESKKKKERKKCFADNWQSMEDE